MRGRRSKVTTIPEAAPPPLPTQLRPSEFWKENDARLLQMIDEGKTTQQTADALGISKNAVIGRARRLQQTWARTPAPKPPEPPPGIHFPTGAGCRWPHGHPSEPETFRFCGEPAVQGKPYCAAHCAVAYKRPPQSQQEAAE